MKRSESKTQFADCTRVEMPECYISLNFNDQPSSKFPVSEKTKRKSEAMKQYFQQYYKDLFNYLQERQDRYVSI